MVFRTALLTVTLFEVRACSNKTGNLKNVIKEHWSQIKMADGKNFWKNGYTVLCCYFFLNFDMKYHYWIIWGIVIVISSLSSHVNSTESLDPLSLHLSRSFITPGKFTRLHPLSSQSWCMLVFAGQPAMVESESIRKCYEFVPTSQAVLSMSCSTYLDGL